MSTADRDNELVLSTVLTLVYIPAMREAVVPLFLTNTIAIFNSTPIDSLVQFISKVDR